MINGVPQLIEFDPKSVTLSHWPKLKSFIKNVNVPVYILSSVPGRNVEVGNILLILKSAGRVELFSFQLLAKGCDEMKSIQIPPGYDQELAFFLLPPSFKLVEQHNGPGRPAKYTRHTAIDLLRRRQRGETYRSIAADTGMSTSTIQRLLATVQSPDDRVYVAQRNQRKRHEDKPSDK
jgi:hypothetical protein